MKELEKYVVPLLGILIIFLTIYWSMSDVGNARYGAIQIISVLAGIAIFTVGLKFEILPISFIISRCKVFVRTLSYVTAISVVLFLIVDLLLGSFYPKVHTPTKFGWNVPEDKKSTTTIQDTKGSYRKVVVQYFKHGFKRWPTNQGNKPRVLVIGDSFTQMVYVANGEEWYAYLEREFPDNAFYVFGAGGYGTLQEYMVMNDYFDKISPQAIIWQFCVNDYSNNYYALDLKNYPYNNHFVRPYLENDEIVYRLPLPYSALRKVSFSADQLLHRYDRRRWREATENLHEFLKRSKEERLNMSPMAKKAVKLQRNKSIAVTKALAKKVRSRAGDIPIYFFEACSGSFTKDDLSVCNAGDFQCIDFIGDFVKSLMDTGKQIKVENNGHWNFAGNKSVGLELANYFKKNGGIIPDKLTRVSGFLPIE